MNLLDERQTVIDPRLEVIQPRPRVSCCRKLREQRGGKQLRARVSQRLEK